MLPSGFTVSPSVVNPPRGPDTASMPLVSDAVTQPEVFHQQSQIDVQSSIPPNAHNPTDQVPPDVTTLDHSPSFQVEPHASPQPSIDSKFNLPVSGMRCFLDICCGVNSPLATAVHSLHGDIMRFDILVHQCDDLLDSACYEQLLRVCSSGIIAYAGASPSCCEYSRQVKLVAFGPKLVATDTCCLAA